jgi:nitroreductase/ferredoxin
MGLLMVDQEKCCRDELCVMVCPSAIIRMSGKTGFPDIIPRGEKACIQCGHCVAVCPTGAMSHARVPLENCPPLQKERTVSEEQAVQFLRSRRSIRRFKPQPVEKADLEHIIHIARYAPSASNSQPIQWIVVSTPSAIHRLAQWTAAHMRRTIADQDASTYAPYWPALVAAWDEGIDVVLRSAPVVVIAAAAANKNHGMTNVTLAANAMGLGTCWAGLLHAAMAADPTFAEQIPLLATHPHHYPLMVGYSAVQYHRMPERNTPVIHQWP